MKLIEKLHHATSIPDLENVMMGLNFCIFNYISVFDGCIECNFINVDNIENKICFRVSNKPYKNEQVRFKIHIVIISNKTKSVELLVN